MKLTTSRTLSVTAALLLTLLSSLPSVINAQGCTDTAGCFPPTGNLALGRTVNVSSTCASGSRFSLFDIFSPGSDDCCTCSAEDTHSPSNLNDNDTSTAWISEIGSSSQMTSLQLDFEAPVLFEGMTLVWQSLRPRAMFLERSSDFGATWEVYRYYATSCMSTFDVGDTFISGGTVLSSTDPICTSVESDLFPFTGGEVTFSTSQHLPSGTDPAVATAYQTVTNLRVQLVSRFEEVEISGTAFQYYGISEWIVNGQCLCNGHASMCVPRPGEDIAINKVFTGCACGHNTVGDTCDECEAGFNNVPWQPGTQTEANICEECMCNGHTSDCEYLPSQSSAVCLGCSDNTTGDQCEQCLPGFYQDPVLMFNDPNICRACECDPAGIADTGLCDGSGQCNCKANVMSTFCDQCEEGYWNLTQDNPAGCQECDCSPLGTMLSPDSNLPLCDTSTGECICRQNVQSHRCDQCMPGYFNLNGGCQPCDCNMGGSESQVCEQDTTVMQCPCKPNIGTSTCSSPLPGYYVRPLDDVVFEAEEASLSEDTILTFPLVGSTVPFTGRGFVTVRSGTNIEFTLMVPEDSQYEVILRYEATTQIEGVIVRIFSADSVTQSLDCVSTSEGVNISQSYNATLSPDDRHLVVDSVCLLSGVQYGLSLSYNSPEWLLDSVLLLPDFSSTSAYYASQTSQFQQDIIEPCLPRQLSVSPLPPDCVEVSFTLSTEFHSQSVLPCDCDLAGSGGGSAIGPDPTCDALGGQCEVCQPGVTGRLCDTCLNGWFDFSMGECQICGCHPVGSVSSVCDSLSGQCACQPGVGGLVCDQCLPGFFNLTSAGCTGCQCSEYATSQECSSNGQCDCPYGVVGLKCDQCDLNFYNISVDGCLDCDCDPLGSTPEPCDTTSGQCTCTGGSTDLDCSQCPNGFFVTDGLVRERCVRCVCSGRSEVCSSDESNFALGAVQTNFSELCSTNPTECSDGWQLLTASGLAAAPYGPSDASGLGYILLVNDFPMINAPERYLGNRQASYGLDFTVVLRISNTGAININTTIVRMVGSLFAEPLVGVFPYPEVVENGFGAERYLTYSITFREDFWHVGSHSGRNPTYLELLYVLSNITEFSFTAQYTEDLIEFVHIVNITFQTALPIAEVVNATSMSTSPSGITHILSPFPTESCVCPEAYQGSSCTECARGFARLSDNILAPCNRCDCNNQTLDCNSRTRECLDCQGNTEGFNCERCRAGFYGDPTRGIPCLQCECPEVGNSFSPTCFLDSDGLQTCDSCAEGYTGRNCETCMDGYFGSPFMGICTTCECYGNVDPALGPVCNTTTGLCLNCLNNTMGFECDICIPGYYGDPTDDTPCQVCPCNPEGTVGDCDRLDGSCRCQPNVIGTLCDECEDTYWGLSQGRGCVACDCCTGNGSTSEICNKDTGDCDCLPNVGSTSDNRCCMCTPGYFNLLPNIGCEACNCSSLAVSESCDQESGRCECQEGAIGLKCDDCAFGFTGRVPDCERCHDCFFQWYDILGNVSAIVVELQSQIDTLISTYYNNHTVGTVQMEITLLLDQLQLANQTLNGINLQLTDIESLNQVLSYVNASILEFNARVRNIKATLREAQRMLNESFAFDGSFNMTLVTDIQMELLLHNTTVAAHAANANMSLTLLIQAQDTAVNLWSDLSLLNMSIQDILLNLTAEETNVETISRLVEEYQTVFDYLRGNLSYLDVHADTLSDQVAMLNAMVGNASQDIYALNGSLLELSDEVESRQSEAEAALELARELNDSLRSAQNVAQSALDMVTILEEYTSGAVNRANSTLAKVLGTLSDVNETISTLSDVKDLVQSILDITLPSVEYATMLAQQIEENILPQDVIDEIVQNASDSRIAAEQALNTIQTARDAVNRAQALVSSLQADLNTTRTAQMEIEQALPRIQGSIDNIQSDNEEIDRVTSEVNTTVQEVEISVNDTLEMIDSAETLGDENQMRINDLVSSSAEEETRIQQHQNDVDQAQNEYATLRDQIDVEEEESVSTLSRATDLNADAQRLNATAHTISLEQLQDLAREYDSEVERVQNLSVRVQSRRQQIQALTDSLNQAAQRLQQCYRTP